MPSKPPTEKPNHPEWLDRELYTLEQVSQLLSLSKRKVEDLVGQGLLRSAIAPGTERARRVSRAMIQEYVDDFNSQNPPRSGGKRHGSR